MAICFFLKKSLLWRRSFFSSKQLLFDPTENLPMVTEGSASGGMRWPWHLGWPVCQCRDRLPWLCREIITSWQRTQLLSLIMAAIFTLQIISKRHLTFNTKQMTWVLIMKLLETMFFSISDKCKTFVEEFYLKFKTFGWISNQKFDPRRNSELNPSQMEKENFVKFTFKAIHWNAFKNCIIELGRKHFYAKLKVW